MYLLIYWICFLPMKICSIFRGKNEHALLIQTAKIGDYVNSSVIFEPLYEKFAKFDVVISGINANFAEFDERIGEIYKIEEYKSGLNKLKLAFLLYKKNYKAVFVLQPKNFNHFLAKMAFSGEFTTISHYKNSSFFRLFAFGARVVEHTKAQLTLETYLKMVNLPPNLRKYKKAPQKPRFVPEISLINSPKFKVGLSLSAQNRIKTFPPKTLEAIFEILSNFDLEVYVFGAEMSELEPLKSVNTRNVEIISLIGKTYLYELPFYEGLMQLYISTDTGNYYIADAQNVPTICFMGPCFDSEQRGVNRTLIIKHSELEPFTAVFDTVTNRDASQYYALSDENYKKIVNFVQEIYDEFHS